MARIYTDYSYENTWGSQPTIWFEDVLLDGSAMDVRGTAPGGLYRKGYRSAGCSNPPEGGAGGWRSPSPMNGWKREATTGWVDFRLTHKTLKRPLLIAQSPYNPGFPGINVPYYKTINNLVKRCTNEAIAELAAAKSNLAVTYLDRQKTLDMGGDLLKKAAYIIDPRNWRISKLGKVIKGQMSVSVGGRTFTDQWLMYRYGILPTMLDLYGIGAAAEDYYVNRPLRISVQKKSSIPFNGSSSVLGYFGSLGAMATTRTRWSGKTDIKVRLDASVSHAEHRAMQQLGIVNPATVVWELIPYSFVLDWFVNIGDYIGGLSAFSGLTFKANSTTIYTTQEWESWAEGSGVYPGTVHPYYLRATSFRDRYEQWNRTVSFVPPSTTLKFKNPISPTHFADGMALLVGLMSSRK